jgi:hypothetical protein
MTGNPCDAEDLVQQTMTRARTGLRNHTPGTSAARGCGGEVVGALRAWQLDGAPHQLHPGDLGWFWRFGAQATAAAVRTWNRDGQILAIGLLDGPDLLRLTIAPDAQQDEELSQQLVADLTQPRRGVLAEGRVYVEAPMGAISVAAAAALRELGSSRAIVCTPSSNVAAVATYRSAGFQQLPEVRDRCRGASPEMPSSGG